MAPRALALDLATADVVQACDVAYRRNKALRRVPLNNVHGAALQIEPVGKAKSVEHGYFRDNWRATMIPFYWPGADCG